MNTPSSQWQFAKDEVAPVFDSIRNAIRAGTWAGLDDPMLANLNPSRVVVSHGSDSRVLEYIITLRGQVFDKKYFKIVVQHDPVPRYSGTPTTNWAVLFWINRIRGAYQHREEIMARLDQTLRPLKIPGFRFETNTQMISTIARFKATSRAKIEQQVNTLLPALVTAILPSYLDIIEAFSTHINEAERKAIISRTQRPAGLNRLGQNFGIDPRFSHTVPRTLRAEAYKRGKGTCQRCKAKVSLDNFHADHITPHSKGGLTELNNLQLLCPECNLAKGNRG